MSQQRDDPVERDRVIADTGWGIKPDDQPSNAAEAAGRVPHVYRYDPADPDTVRHVIVAQRRGFNTANRVRVESGRLLIFDINRDAFTVEGMGYGAPHLVPLLHALGAAFNPEDLLRVAPGDVTAREYPLSRAWAWAEERPAG